MKRWKRPLGTKEQRWDFQLAVFALDSKCVMEGISKCKGNWQAAHVVPKRKLRDLQLSAHVVYDAGAAMTLCERHHNRHDRGLEKVPWDRVPERCKRFIHRFGLEVLLERTYEEVRPA